METKKSSVRPIFLALSLIALFLLGADFYLQYAFQFTVDYLDHIERLIMLLLFMFLFMGTFHISTSPNIKKFYFLMTLIVSGTGMFVSGRHVWLQKYASDFIGAQISTLTPQLQQSLSWRNLIHLIYTGTAASTQTQWAAFGITLSEWTFLCFLLFFVIAVIAWITGSSNPGFNN